MLQDDLLFYRNNWHTVSKAQESSLRKEIRDYEDDKLLNTSVEDLAQYFSTKYCLEVPILQESDINVSQQEVDIDVSGDSSRRSRSSGPQHIKGTQITVEVPFEGNRDLFSVRPTRYTFNPPRAKVYKNNIIIKIQGTNLNSSNVRQTIDSEIANIKSYLQNLSNNAAPYNSGLHHLSKTAIEARRAKLLADRSLVSELGFPLKTRDDSSSTYAAPHVKRKIRPTTPKCTGKPYKPEPVLTNDDYEHILSVIQNMVLVMERSPSAFNTMNEEDLRTHFLVQLNGHYEGQATGETFNYEGKTDILVRADGKNIFIGECKYWGGTKILTKTIDQVLSYSSWRDTKIAIIVFNRNKNFSTVIESITPTMESHPSYKRSLKRSSETQSSFIFAHKDDPNREMTITVLAFDIPT